MRHSLLMRSMVFAGMLGAATQAWARVEVKHAGSVTTYDITVDDVSFQQVSLGGMTFQEASLMGVDGYTGFEHVIGQPEIPVVRLMTTGDVQVSVFHDFDFSTSLVGKAAIKPAQPSWDKNRTMAPPMTYDASAYRSMSFMANQEYTIEAAGSIRGEARKLVTLRPFQYRPGSGEYHMIRSFRVTVRQASSLIADQNVTPTIAMVIGAQFAESPKLNELIQLKESQGFRVQRIVVGQNSVNTDVDIRAALQKLLKISSVNLRYAILIGDIEDVPSHESKTIHGVTDHFYRAIDTDDYEADVNGPDIGVGRISVQSEAQLAVVVDKIARYSQGKFNQDKWLNHPSFVTTHDRYAVAEGTHNTVIEKYFAPKGYDRSFPNANEKGGDKLYPITNKASASDIVSNMRSGRIIINYSGHGSNGGWEDVTTNDVKTFSDPDSLPYVIGNACITADFRVSSVFGETWLRQPNGAIVYWGSMDSSYWDEDDYLEKGLYEGMFVKGIRSFDLMHQYALAAVWKQYGGAEKSKYYWETYVTLGDPSLEFRPGRALEVTLEGVDGVIAGSSESQMKVLAANGSGIANVHAALRRPSDGVTVLGTSGVDGTVALKVDAFAGKIEPLTLTVHGPDVQTVVKTVPMIAPDRPFYSLSQWRFNKRTGGGVFVGEKIALNAVIENFGAKASVGGRVFIAKASGPVQVERGDVAVPALASRGKGEIGDGLIVSAATSATRSDVIELMIAWESKEGSSGQTKLVIPVLRGDLAVTAVDYGNTGHEGIRGTGDLYVTMKNIGSEVIRNATLTGVASTCTSAVSGQLKVVELKPGEVTRIAQPFFVTSDNSCQNGTAGQFNVKGAYQGGASAVSLVAGATYVVGDITAFHQSQKDMALAIPDHSSPIEKAFTVAESGKIKDISIAVRILHPYSGDIKIALVTPGGTIIPLQSNQGSNAANINKRWGRGGEALPELAKLSDQEVHGTWKVTVQDTQTSDEGTWEDVDFEVRHW